MDLVSLLGNVKKTCQLSTWSSIHSLHEYNS